MRKFGDAEVKISKASFERWWVTIRRKPECLHHVTLAIMMIYPPVLLYINVYINVENHL